LQRKTIGKAQKRPERLYTHCIKRPKQGKKVTNKLKKEGFFLRKKVFIFLIKDFKLKKKDFRSNKLVFIFEKRTLNPINWSVF